ncbi:ADP-ribosylation factor-like protein 15 [Calliphora vicina]|uniref:ADP-ribosylation factor-like protein 15 n=1 Tax=Calliphora vicina TaxID=7373 RepID=UPI00325ADB11
MTGAPCVGIVPDKKLKFLLLGLSGSGKTEIAHYLSKAQRLDYDSTNGVHNYSFKLMETLCSLTEVGGSDDMQRIWHHYYVGTMAVIYCFDLSSKYDDLKKSFKLLHTVLKNPYIMAKPILLVATKADLADESIQLYDIENAFHIQNMAVSYGSSIKLCCYDPRTEQNEENMNTNVKSGIQWLVSYILNNYNVIQMRLNCDKNMQNWEQQRNKLVAEGKLDFKKYERFPKSSSRHKLWRLSRKRLRRSLIRPRTAPPKICCISTLQPTAVMFKDSTSFNVTNNSSNKVPNGEVKLRSDEEHTIV